MPVKSKPALVILNLPELAGTPPEWRDVCGSFRGAHGSVIIQTMMRMLLGQMARARLMRETNPRLPADEAKFCDGEAGAANEMLTLLLGLVKGEVDKFPADVKGLFKDTVAPKAG